MPVTSWTPQNVFRPVVGGFRPAALATKAVAQQIAPKKTGRLAQGTSVKFTGATSALLVNRVPYVYPVTGGAKPHTIAPRGISPKTGRKLKSYRPNAALKVGNRFYANVQHPGIQGNPFLNRAAQGFSIVYAAEVRRRFR